MVDGPPLRVLRSDSPRKVILFYRGEISPGEAVSLLTRTNAVNDISIKEPDIEDVIRGIYERRAVRP